MNSTSKFLYFTSILLGLMFTSCSHPDKDFKKMLEQKSEDKFVDKVELSSLDRQLQKALKKSQRGIIFGVDTIKSHDSMVGYLVDKKGCEVEGEMPAKAVKFDTFHILLENSISMQGYIGRGNPDFAEPIIALLHCGAQTNHTAYAGADGSSNPAVLFQDMPQNQFLNNITQGKFISSAASPLDKMIEKAVEMIVEKASEGVATIADIAVNDVFCLITDGILSGTNNEISQDPDFNKKSLPVLENRIRQAVDKAYKYGLQCLVYRLEAPFNGTYFDYKNGRHFINGPRPYYMLMIGDQQNLEIIERQLSKETNFTRHPSQRFASYDVTNKTTITKASISQLPGQPAIRASGNTIKYNPVKLNPDPVVFTVKMLLKSLPEYYLESLQNDLELTYYDNPSSTDVTIPVESWLRDIKVEPSTYTYVFTVCLDNQYLRKMTSAKTSVRISLPGHQDKWYLDLSASDDSNISAGDITTFGLERFMGGIMKGFGYQDSDNIPDAISLEYNLLKI